jgi:hypothetical protein
VPPLLPAPHSGQPGPEWVPAYDRAVTPFLPLAGGALALVVAALLLRTYGARYRVARLLATVPAVSLSDALAAAKAGERRYVRVEGRVDSEESFEDAAHRPLVFRRTRLQARSGGRWRTFEDGRQRVPFEVGDGLRAVAIDGDALGDGLVVIPRESTGTAADLPDRAPAGVPPEAPVRAIVEQVSAVEQAIVLGVPVAEPDGRVRMTAGLDRPLILTTLEPAEAMRVLGEGRRSRAQLVAASAVLGIVLLAAGLGWLAIAAVAGTRW